MKKEESGRCLFFCFLYLSGFLSFFCGSGAPVKYVEEINGSDCLTFLFVQ